MGRVMARAKADTVQVTFRIPRRWLRLLDEVAVEETKATHGMQCSRTEAIRRLVLTGLSARGKRFL